MAWIVHRTHVHNPDKSQFLSKFKIVKTMYCIYIVYFLEHIRRDE